MTVVVTLVVVGAPDLWRRAKVAVTLVHELGHALVGIACGRRFTGFVVRGDMSGHAVTVGPARGAGRVATTWAGYPMPAAVGALMVWCAQRGDAAPFLTVALAVLAGSLVMVRSAGTALVVLLAGGGLGALWWWRSDPAQAHVLVGVGAFLLVGAWRHLATVAGSGRSDTASDPAVLARLTGVPRLAWLLSYAVALGLATWAAVGVVRGGL